MFHFRCIRKPRRRRSSLTRRRKRRKLWRRPKNKKTDFLILTVCSSHFIIFSGRLLKILFETLRCLLLNIPYISVVRKVHKPCWEIKSVTLKSRIKYCFTAMDNEIMPTKYILVEFSLNAAKL